MRQPHFLHIGNETFAYLVVGIIGFFVVGRRAHPAGEMYFIYTPGLIQGIIFFASLHPGLILTVIVQVPGNGCGLWPLFPEMRKGIAFYGFGIIKSPDVVFIYLSPFHVWNETFPYTRFFQTDKQRMGGRVPVIEISDY